MQNRSRGLIATLVILFVLIIDQWIKVYVKTHFSLYEMVDVTSWFKLYFIENDGMAFGLDFLGTQVLAIFRIVAIFFFLIYLKKRILDASPLGLIVCLCLIIAGAAGNLIDNCLYGEIFSQSIPQAYGGTPAVTVPFGEGYGDVLAGKVVDMFYFPLFQWPSWLPVIGGKTFFSAIFNFADASINVGAFCLLIFYYKRLFNSEKSVS